VPWGVGGGRAAIIAPLRRDRHRGLADGIDWPGIVRASSGEVAVASSGRILADQKA